MLSGTNNQESVTKATNFQVLTQLYEVANNGLFYEIDAGEWPSDFTTTPGSVSTTTGVGKVMSASSWVTYASDVEYTVFFTTYQYVPKGGSLMVKLP